MWIEVIRSKSDAFKLFKKIKAMAEAEAQRGLRALRSDRGGEFNSGEFKLYCEEFGIKHFTAATEWRGGTPEPDRRRDGSVLAERHGRAG
jgi:hypothetical protein